MCPLQRTHRIHCCGYLLTPFLSVCTERRWQEHYQYCREQKGQQLLHSDTFALREQLMTVKEIQSIQLFSLQSRRLSSSRQISGSPTGWSSGSQCPGLGEHIHFPQHTVGYRQVEEIDHCNAKQSGDGHGKALSLARQKVAAIES